ncbi:MAG: chalcone isomerase family protein [Gammaproteobacteria bacterium]|nr:chalcone isomerase family protein [Gammaproteobacteria bacterium]
MKIFGLLGLLLVFIQPVYAVDIADRSFAEVTTMTGYEHDLKLNGIGVRYKFFFKIYIAALYMENTATDLNMIIESKQGKRMVMHFVYDKVEKEKLVDAWLDGFESNLGEEEYKRLEPAIKKFNALFDTVVTDDVYYLDWIPGSGTRVSLNGQEKGVIEDESFYPALLKIWLGDEPVNEELKQALSGAD